MVADGEKDLFPQPTLELRVWFGDEPTSFGVAGECGWKPMHVRGAPDMCTPAEIQSANPGNPRGP